MQLTELGRALLPNFREIYDSANQARERARRLTSGQKESVRVGVMCTIDFHQVLPGFAQSQEVSAAELIFRDGNLEALTDALDQGDVDLGIMCSPYDIPKRFTTTPLFREDYVLAIGDDHRFTGRASVEMEELHREHYCERTLCEFSAYIERLLRARDVALEVVHKSPREDWIQAFVRANFGVAFMPLSIAEGRVWLTCTSPAARSFVRLVCWCRPSGQPARRSRRCSTRCCTTTGAACSWRLRTEP